MPFGKYQGVLVAELPDDYLRWLHDQVSLRQPLRATVEREFASRFARKNATVTRLQPEALKMAEDLVSAGYRKLAQLHHPDLGGDHRGMVLVNDAAEFLRKALRSALQ